MSVSHRSTALAAFGCLAASFVLASCTSSAQHNAASLTSGAVSASPSSTTAATTSAAATSSAATTRAASTAATHAVTKPATHPATTSKQAAGGATATGSCGSQLSPGGHAFPVWNAASGKVETNPKCIGLDMHNQLLDVSYDLHGNNPTEAMLRNAESAATTVTEAATVVFSNYGSVGNVVSERTVTVTLVNTKRKYAWNLTKSSAGLSWVSSS